MKKTKPDGKRDDCRSDPAENGVSPPRDHIDRPPPSEEMIEFVRALARIREEIDYEVAKAAWLAEQRTGR